MPGKRRIWMPHSRLSRRALVLLGAAPLLPLVLIAVIGLTEWKRQTAEDAEQALRAQTTRLALGLSRELGELNANLSELAGSRRDLERAGWQSTQLGGLQLYQPPGEQPLSARNLAEIPLHLPDFREHLARGGGALATVQSTTLPRLYLLRLLQDRGRAPALMALEVDLRALHQSRPPASGMLCVLTAKGVPIDCLGEPPGPVLSTYDTEQRGSTYQPTHWSGEGRAWSGAFWRLRTDARYLLPELVLFHALPEAALPTRPALFLGAFTPALVLTGAVTVLLALSVLWHLLNPPPPEDQPPRRRRRRPHAPNRAMAPPRALQVAAPATHGAATAMQRSPPTAAPGLPAALADIDRLVLTGESRQAMVDLLLERLPALTGCDAVGVVQLEQDRMARLSWRYDASPTDASPLRPGTALEAEALAALEGCREYLLQGPGDSLACLGRVFELGMQRVASLPVRGPAGLSSLVVLAYRDAEAAGESALLHGRALVDRAAIALSSAEWQEKLYQIAHYDPLTRLPNRQFFIGRLDQALAEAQRQQSMVGLLFIDLDRFKSVNDSLGHSEGDEYLSLIARRLRECLDEDCTLARVGGDEFTVIVPGLSSRRAALDRSHLLAERLRQAMLSPVTLHGQRVALSGSMGVAFYPEDARSRVGLMRCAEQAMYHCKNRERNAWAYYAEDMNASALERLEMAAELEGALDRGELEIFLQPQIAARDGSIVGAEALLRWRHPRLGMVPPGRFIPVAEQMGFIVPFGLWALEQACRQLRAWRERGLDSLRLSVNLSVLQLRQPEHVEALCEALRRHAADASQLELEVTESIWVEDPEAARAVFERLRALGVRISIDDFGTGYSSMTYLRHFPVDVIKIDQSFIRGLPGDEFSRSCTAATITLAHSLGCTVVAEGVENAVQFNYLRGQGCEVMQGHYLAEPMPVEHFQTFHDSWSPRLVCPLKLVSG